MATQFSARLFQQRWIQAYIIIFAILAGAFYFRLAGGLQSTSAATDIYSLQLQAWYDGHTYLGLTPHPALAHLKNPYDPAENGPYRILDISYFQNHFYSYYGVGPLLLVLLPWHFFTGEFLTEGSATLLFVCGTLLLSLLILHEVWRAYFRASPPLLVVACAALVCFGNLSILHLASPSFYQVAQSSANFCQLGSLFASLKVLTGRKRIRWLIVASLAAGLAVACRPSFLIGGISLLPVTIAAGLTADTQKGRLSYCLGAATAALLPAALICLGLCWYNWIRFGSPQEFGDSYILAGYDQRGMTFMSWRFLSHNLWTYFFNPAQSVHFFPFLRPPVHPLGLYHFPFLFLSVGVSLLLLKPRRTRHPGLGFFVVALTLAALGTFAILLVFVEAWLRYEVDFYVPMLLLAAIGWLTLCTQIKSGLWRRINLTVGALLAIVTIANVMFLSAAFREGQLPNISRWFNTIVAAVDSARGFSYGPVELSVSLPTKCLNGQQRLITTGFNLNDWVYLQEDQDGNLRIGYFHAGVGGPLSRPFARGSDNLHRVDIMMGSLLPVDDHPYFQGWSPTEIYRAKHLLSVSWDGHEVLHATCDFYESGPADLAIGPEFSTINRPSLIVNSSRRHNFERAIATRSSPEFNSFARLTVTFPSGHAEVNEPLLSTGVNGAGDLLFVHYLPSGALRFGVDGWNGALFESEPVEVDPTRSHTLYIKYGGLKTDGDPGTAFAIILDDRLVAFGSRKFHPSKAETVVWGLNAIHSSVAGTMFSGTISEVAPITEDEFNTKFTPQFVNPPGIVSFWLNVDYNPSLLGQPLVVTGRNGAGDFVYLKQDNENQARVCFDHWGAGGMSGAPFTIDYKKPHLVSVTMGSLYSKKTASEAQLKTLRVTIDGHTVLESQTDCHPSTPEEIAIGSNGIGGSTCAPFLSGRIIMATTRSFNASEATEADPKITPIDTLTDKPQQYGAVRMAVQFPVVSNPRAEPLVVSGRPGAGDFIYVAYAGDGTLRLGYDHWGIGGPLSESIPVNQQDQETHLLEISMGSLFPAVENDAAWGKVSPETRRQLKATIIIKMDGRTMLQHHSLAYPAGQSEVNVGSNPVGGSTCETIFTGRVLLSERIPPHLSVPTGPP